MNQIDQKNSLSLEEQQDPPQRTTNSSHLKEQRSSAQRTTNFPLKEQQTSVKRTTNSPPPEGWQAQPDWVVKRNTKSYKSLPYNPALRERARELRKAGMLHEVLLWQRLSKKQLHGLDFDRQKIIGNYIVDFFCASVSLVIEIDGSSHDDKNEYDQQRDAYLEGLGLRVLHIRAKDVLQDIDAVMEYLRTTPSLRATPPEEGNYRPQLNGR